ncbi:MAG: ECF-type sigma factor [Phycisphaerales bacterium]
MADKGRSTPGPESQSAAEALLPRLYDELRAQAARYLKRERSDHTLSPTALVHEAFVRLVGIPGAAVVDDTHFAALAAGAMRRALVDHARARAAAKRRPEEGVIRLDTGVSFTPRRESQPVDVLAIHEALERLSTLHERQSRLVELRFFGGMTTAQAASALGISLPTAEADWRMARTWLHRELSR